MLLLAEYKRLAYFKKDFLAVASNEFVVLFLWFFLCQKLNLLVFTWLLLVMCQIDIIDQCQIQYESLP